MAPTRTRRVVVVGSFWLLVAASGIAPARAQRDADAEPALDRGFPPMVTVAGSPRERGVAYGRQFRSGIRTFLDREILSAMVDQPASREEMLAYAAACAQVVRDQCPMIADELAGVAEGAGLTFDEVMLINLHEEFYHRTGVPKSGHCTAVAVAPPDTGSGQTYVGQTWDWMESVAGLSSVVQWRRGDGVSVLAYGFPGMPMGAGINAAGIALCWTSAALEDHQTRPRVGLPSYVLIAHLLNQKDLASVEREARKDRHAGWFTFVIADGAGNLLNLEGSPHGIAAERPTERLARVSYGTRDMTGVSAGQRVPLHPRCQKMYELLGESAGCNDLARLQDYFTRPDCGISAGRSTIDMMVFDTTECVAYLSRGPAYDVAWRAFRFDEPR